MGMVRRRTRRRTMVVAGGAARAPADAGLIVENFGVVPAVTGDAVGREMAMYVEAVKKVGIGAHALAGTAHNGG